MPGNTGEALFLGRQPILDRGRHVRAYELLFRDGKSAGAHVVDDAQATATVIVNAFAELGMTHVLQDCDAYINVDQQFLFSEVIELLPRRGVVIELLESVPHTASVAARCMHLRAMGYTLALDDVVAFDARNRSLLPLVQIVKVDVLAVAGDALRPLVAQLRRAAPHVRLLAEKVETAADFERCMDLGFVFFQGYHFAKPTTVAGRQLGHSHQALLRLLAQLGADADSSELEETLKAEPGLTVNLLRMVNSAGTGLSRPVNSLRDVIQVLGRRYLKRWVQLLLFSVGQRQGEPSPLLLMAATRGRLMELTATLKHPEDDSLADSAFMAGMMSLMPALVGMKIEEVLAPLHLAPVIDDALLRGDGPLGPLLKLAEASERGDAESLAGALYTGTGPTVDASHFSRAQAQALEWAHTLRRGPLAGLTV